MGGLIEPKEWSNATQEKLEYLEGLVGVAVREKIETLESRVADLTSERDILKGQVSQHNKLVESIRAEAKAQIDAVSKQHRDGSNRQKGVWEERVNSLDFEINKLRSDKLRLEQELNKQQEINKALDKKLVLEQTKSGCLERIEDNTNKIIDMMHEALVEIKRLIDLGESSDKISNTVKTTILRVDIQREIEEIIRLEDMGLSDNDIANKLWPNLTRRKQKLSERRSHKIYKQIRGGGTDVTEQYDDK